ncbi:hypothetical protein BDR03DRAFT_866181, partial [Suillus americanus]
LKQHLFCLTKVTSPDCPHYLQTEETIHHYLVVCPQFQLEHHMLAQVLGQKCTSLLYLLAAPEAIPYLVCYINKTCRLRPMLGEISMPSAQMT